VKLAWRRALPLLVLGSPRWIVRGLAMAVMVAFSVV
jgi:hypothetical protein